MSTILNQNHEVLATKRSFNTALGLPVVLSQYQQQQFAVFEAGADQHGELKALSAMLRPDIAVITTIASAHLKGFGSLKGVAQAKSELFTHLSPQGIAVINQDAPYAELCQQLAGDHSIVTFSTQQQADFTAHNLYYDSAFNLRFTLKTPSGQFDALLPLLGKHQAVNALAATACAYYLGLDSDQIQSGLAQVQPEKHRMQRYQGANGSCIIDDSYNANPESTRSALELLSAMPGYRILVIGDMLDLDQHNEVQYHYAVADQAHNLNIDKIYSIGKLASKVTERFPGPSCHYQDLDALTAHLYQVVNANTNVLVKASRGMQLDQIVSKLKQE